MKRRKAAYALKYANKPKKCWKPDPEKQAKKNEMYIFQLEINKTEEKFLNRLPLEDPAPQIELMQQIMNSCRQSQVSVMTDSQSVATESLIS